MQTTIIRMKERDPSLERELEWQTRTVDLRLAQCPLLFVLYGIESSVEAEKRDRWAARFRAGFYNESPAALRCPVCGSPAIVDGAELPQLQARCLSSACGWLFDEPSRGAKHA